MSNPLNGLSFQKLNFPGVLRATGTGNSPESAPERIWRLKASVHE
jgi:hypothetical protein